MPPTRHLDTLKEWSTKYGWQDRIPQAVTERGMQLLAQASELDIEIFFATSREYHLRLNAQDIETMPLPALHHVRSPVRRKDPTGGQTINVVIVQEAERLAAELGTNAGLEATIPGWCSGDAGGAVYMWWSPIRDAR